MDGTSTDVHARPSSSRNRSDLGFRGFCGRQPPRSGLLSVSMGRSLGQRVADFSASDHSSALIHSAHGLAVEAGASSGGTYDRTRQQQHEMTPDAEPGDRGAEKRPSRCEEEPCVVC